MVKEYIENINKNIEVRQNLIKIKEELKDTAKCYAFKYELEDGKAFFKNLFDNEDAKVRKNAAAIIGALGDSEYLSLLFEAYKNETQLFVKSSYLKAIGALDYREIVTDLRDCLEELKKIPVTEDNIKHISEEKKYLNQLILNLDGIEKHEFTGFNKKTSLILITNRNYPDITLNQINEIYDGDSNTTARVFNAGVMVTTDRLEPILDIRTYKELLFILDDVKSCDKDPVKASQAIADSSLLKFLKDRHKGKKEYYFRVEYKGKIELSTKSAFTKKFAANLEHQSEGKLINSTSNYEVEIRLIENKEGRLNVLVKLFTIPDKRFDYRTESVAASIQPVNAALIMKLASEYLMEDARVLDPFCGVGTMLIERIRHGKVNTLYGIDIYGDAIQKARTNCDNAKVIAHFINKDFFDFEHDYVFDEIVTNMPRISGHKMQAEIEEIFRKFFIKAPEHMSADGTIIMHCYEPELAEKYSKNGFKLIRKFEISMKEKSYLYIFRER